MSDEKITVKVDDSELEILLGKVERLQSLIKDAKSLADELASKDISITICI